MHALYKEAVPLYFNQNLGKAAFDANQDRIMEKEKLRLDKYLWSIRLFKTRSLASEACEKGKVKCNGVSVKPSRQVHAGDEFEIKTEAKKWLIKVTGLLYNRVQYAEAINFYSDITPAEEQDSAGGDHRTPARGDRGTELWARHTHALLALADAVDTLDADRGRPLTFRAGRQAAALAPHIGHPIGVPRADRLCLVWRGLTHA